LPADRAATLRAAFAATLRDPEFQKDVERSRLETNLVPAEEVDAVLKDSASAPMDVIEREHLMGNATEVGNHMLKRMASWPHKHRSVGEVRGRGLMIGVEIVKDKATREYGGQERDRIVELAFERGILFLGCGPSTVRIAPPLIVTKDEADVAMDVLDECITIVEEQARKAAGSGKPQGA
jgi:4-aminobutyrate aminotransferase